MSRPLLRDDRACDIDLLGKSDEPFGIQRDAVLTYLSKAHDHAVLWFFAFVTVRLHDLAISVVSVV
jgi:hypothetical protein